MIRTLFFDSAGVLVKEGFTPGIAEYEKKHEIPTGTLYASAHNRKYWKDFTLGFLSEEAYFQKVAVDFRAPLDTGALKKLIYELSRPNKELLAYLRTLRDRYRLGIISNNPKEWFDYFWYTFGWNEIFHTRSISSEVHVRKPEKAIFQDALAKAGVSAADSVYVDDNDDKISGARELGIKVIIFKGVSQLKAEFEEFVV